MLTQCTRRDTLIALSAESQLERKKAVEVQKAWLKTECDEVLQGQDVFYDPLHHRHHPSAPNLRVELTRTVEFQNIRTHIHTSYSPLPQPASLPPPDPVIPPPPRLITPSPPICCRAPALHLFSPPLILTRSLQVSSLSMSR